MSSPGSIEEIYPFASSPSIASTCILFGTILFTCFSLCAKCFLSGDARAINYIHVLNAEAKSNKLNLSDFTSVLTLLHQLTIFGCMLLFARMCKCHPPYPHRPKSYDRDDFFFMMLILALAGLCSLEKNSNKKREEMLNRSGRDGCK